MNLKRLPVLYEDNHLLAIDKPAGLATMGVAAGEPSVVQWAKQYLKTKYQKPGNVYLGVVSRLDAFVSGVVVLARTSKAAARLTEQFRSHSVDKVYWALVPEQSKAEQARPPIADAVVESEWTDWLLKDETHHRMIVVPEGTPGSQQAVLRYRTLRRLGRLSLAEIGLVTGRKHQIRVQLAARGLAVVGDRKYGSRLSFPAGIALHARRLLVEHPTRHEPVDITAPVPASWRPFGVENG